MMYVIANRSKRNDKGGNPVYLNAVVRDDISVSDLMTIKHRMPWSFNGELITDIPTQLYLIVRRKYIDFDFRYIGNSFVISEKLFEIIKPYVGSDVKFIPLESLNAKFEAVSPQDYYYIHFDKLFSIVDYDASNYTVSLEIDGVKLIDKYQKIVADPTLSASLSFFGIQDSLLSTLCCGITKDLVEIIRNAKIEVDIVEVSELSDYINNNISTSEFDF